MSIWYVSCWDLHEDSTLGPSLGAQWQWIHLSMQETPVWSLVQEDPTCQGTNNPVHHNYWSQALEPLSCNSWSLCTWRPCSTTWEKPPQGEALTLQQSSHHLPQLEKFWVQQWKTHHSQKIKLTKEIFYLKKGIFQMKYMQEGLCLRLYFLASLD